MNTPKSKASKRFDLQAWKAAYWKDVGDRNGVFGMALANSDAAISFALTVTEFTHLEHYMEEFAALVIGTDWETASHILRSIVSVKGRMDVLRNVLERARQNADKPAVFDEIIDEFYAINNERNQFVHSQYMTNEATGEVSWIKLKDDPLLHRDAAYKPFNPQNLEELRDRISALRLKISYQLALAQHEASAPPDDHS